MSANRKTLTKAQAAEILGVSQRAIYRYIHRGYLRRDPAGRSAGVSEADVLELKRLRDAADRQDGGELPFAVNKATLALLHARTRTLEIQVATVMKLLSIKNEPLRLTDPEIRSLHAMAGVYAERGWPPHAEQTWPDVFVRLRLEDLEQLERVVGDPHPWRAFYRLCSTMFLVPFDADLRPELEQGKSNLFGLAGIWAQLRGVTSRTVDRLLSEEAPPRRVVRRLERGRAEESPGSTR